MKAYVFSFCGLGMNDTMSAIFDFLSKLPVTLHSPINFWFWLMVLVTPGLIFCVPVKRSTLSHITRVLFSIGITYVLINLARYADAAFGWRDYEACQDNSVHPYMSPEMYNECGHHVNIADGGSYMLLFSLGWAIAAFYVGLWELIWRVWHRKQIKAMGKQYTGKWFSNLTILFLFVPFLTPFLAYFVSRYYLTITFENSTLLNGAQDPIMPLFLV